MPEVTLRQFFAGLCLSSFVTTLDGKVPSAEDLKNAAESAFKYADAMLAVEDDEKE